MHAPAPVEPGDLLARRSPGRSVAQLVELGEERVDAFETLTRSRAAAEVADRRGRDLGPERAAEGAEEEIGLDRKAGEDLAALRVLREATAHDVRRGGWYLVAAVRRGLEGPVRVRAAGNRAGAKDWLRDSLAVRGEGELLDCFVCP